MAAAENVGRKPNGDPLFGDQYDEDGGLELIDDLKSILECWKSYQKRGSLDVLNENVFICKSESFLNDEENKSFRFDLQYHHPAKAVAQEVLKNSKYPLVKLADLVTVRNLSTIPNNQDPEDIWTYLGLANITSQTGEYNPTQVTGNQLKSAVRLYKPGDILFSKLRPELRKVILIKDEESEGYVSSECIVMTPLETVVIDRKTYKLDSKYLAYALRSDVTLGQVIYQVSGVGRPRINMGTLLNVRIPVPSHDQQYKIVKDLDKLHITRKSLENEIRKSHEKIQAIISTTHLQIKDSLRS